MTDFSSTRADALDQLAAFLPHTGRAYAARRNYDVGAGAHTAVSRLSPSLRHRLILEREVLAAVLTRQTPSSAEKFIAEVYWRTYFKGFLEVTPSIWTHYRSALSRLRDDIDTNPSLRADIEAAESGSTGIDCFDHWVRELVDTGYLHNHARMWFASIWIFTLRLPWQLGADFFLRHLLDGDAASNTLSWRWVGGLHTRGKTYLARPDNIARYTNGRFQPTRLATTAEPLADETDHPQRPVPTGDAPPAKALLLVTEDDCVPETLFVPGGACDRTAIAGTVAADSTEARSTRPVSDLVRTFAAHAVADAARRSGNAPLVPLTAQALAQAAQNAGATAILTPYAPVGPTADILKTLRPRLGAAGITLHTVLRPEDAKAWPHANRGFFKLKKAIPNLLPV